jgi:hypothetical protein
MVAIKDGKVVDAHSFGVTGEIGNKVDPRLFFDGMPLQVMDPVMAAANNMVRGLLFVGIFHLLNCLQCPLNTCFRPQTVLYKYTGNVLQAATLCRTPPPFDPETGAPFGFEYNAAFDKFFNPKSRFVWNKRSNEFTDPWYLKDWKGMAEFNFHVDGDGNPRSVRFVPCLGVGDSFPDCMADSPFFLCLQTPYNVCLFNNHPGSEEKSNVVVSAKSNSSHEKRDSHGSKADSRESLSSNDASDDDENFDGDSPSGTNRLALEEENDLKSDFI